MTLSVSAYQNEYLPAGAGEVHAVITVAAGADQTQAATSEKAVVLIVDTSGSMSTPGSKIRAARRATATAVSLIPDGTWFAVIAGSHQAWCAYPPAAPGRWPQLARADAGTRGEAVQVAHQLPATGGTAMSTWLELARGMFERHPGAIRLAYLLTDGKNESEPRSNLEAALARSAGVFQCDARGVGADWIVSELRLVTSTLLGQVELIAEPDQMDDDFKDFLERAIGKSVADVRLRLWAPQGSRLRFLRQVAPAIEDLTARVVAVNSLTGDFPTGAWAPGETRDYHVCIDVPPGDVDDEKLAARVSLVVDGELQSQALVRAIWTDDPSLSTRINAHVAHYTGQKELADTIQQGLEARKLGDEKGATLRLGRAVQLAHQSGNESTVRLLNKVVDIDDPATGTVRLRRTVDMLDEMALDTRSTRTVRVTAKPATGTDEGATE
jgi:hypothetical protein